MWERVLEGGVQDSMDGDGRSQKPSTEEALAAWRAASRELDHATEMVTTAELAQAAARKAEQAAADTADAARTAAEAANLAAETAKSTAEMALLTREQSDTDLAKARSSLDAATSAEGVARARHHDVQGEAFERHGYDTGADPEPEAGGVA